MSTIVDSTATHIVNAPLERVDLARWLFSLTDAEYRACSSAHIAGGTSRAPDGRRMSINVERISGNLLVQRYVEDVAGPDHVRVRSLSDSFTSGGETVLDILWELRVTPVAGDRCELSNRVVVTATPQFLASLTAAGVTSLDTIAPAMRASTTEHNREETPLFARDIECKALAGAWTSQED